MDNKSAKLTVQTSFTKTASILSTHTMCQYEADFKTHTEGNSKLLDPPMNYEILIVGSLACGAN